MENKFGDLLCNLVIPPFELSCKVMLLSDLALTLCSVFFLQVSILSSIKNYTHENILINTKIWYILELVMGRIISQKLQYSCQKCSCDVHLINFFLRQHLLANSTTIWFLFQIWQTFFLAHLSQRLKWAIVIAHRPSARPSARRLSSDVR